MNIAACLALNNYDLTRQWVDDVLAQDVDCLALVFDNGSTDRTTERLSEINDPRVNIIRSETNIGVGPGWNQIATMVFSGILGIQSDHVLLTNNDVRLRPDTYRSLLIPKGGFITPVNVGSWEKALAHDAEKYPIPEEPIQKGGPDFSCFLLHKWFYEAIGGFTEVYYPGWFEDNETHWVAKCKGLDSQIFSIAHPYYHIGSQTLKNNPEIQKLNATAFEQNKQLYIARWGGVPGREIYTTPYDGKI